MLVLKRMEGERIQIGDDIWITVKDCKPGSVRLCVDAPKDVRVMREEIIKKEVTK